MPDSHPSAVTQYSVLTELSVLSFLILQFFLKSKIDSSIEILVHLPVPEKLPRVVVLLVP